MVIGNLEDRVRRTSRQRPVIHGIGELHSTFLIQTAISNLNGDLDDLEGRGVSGEEIYREIVNRFFYPLGENRDLDPNFGHPVYILINPSPTVQEEEMFLQEITEAVQALDFSPEEVGKAEEILFPGESFESGSYYNGFLSSVDRVNNIVEIFHGKRQFVVEYGPDMLYIEGSSNRNIAKGTFITNYAKSRGIQVVLLDEGNELFEKGDELEPELEIEYKKSREPRWISNIQQNPPKGKSLAIAGIAHFKKMHDYPIYGEFPNLLGKAGIYFQLMEDLSLLIKPFDNYKI